jgi:uncharacterized protein (DUF2236 family)
MQGTPTISPACGSSADSAEPNLISRQINAERFVLLAWTRAVLLQLAHPLIAAGVYDHSGFRTTPFAALKRLRHTVQAMLTLTFGDDFGRARTIERVRAVHKRVHGTLPVGVGPYPAGTPYSAEDPALVLWVHATLIDSIASFYELVAGPLSPEERNAFCAEAAPVAAALGAPNRRIPLSWHELQTYMRHGHDSGQLVVGAQSRELAGYLLAPPFGLLGSWGVSLNRIVTLGILPAGIRQQYGFDWTDASQRSFTRTLATLRLTRRLLPARFATWRIARRG